MATTSISGPGFPVIPVAPRTDGDNYCFTGQVKNLSSGLQSYLVIAALLYDSQDKMIKFSDYKDFGPPTIEGDQTLLSEICISPPIRMWLATSCGPGGNSLLF
jgi:hypothetical protein